jgi:hypothetical protein
MWKLQTDSERIQSKIRRRRKALLHGLYTGCCVLILIPLIHKFHGSGPGPHDPNLIPETSPPYTWEQILTNIPAYLFGAILTGLFVFFVMRSDKNETRVCVKCGNLEQSKNDVRCLCGGELHKLDDMIWTE